MRSGKCLERGAALAVGTLILFFVGIVYAWSIYSTPFSAEFGWSSARLGVCFTLIISAFCLGGVLGSSLSAKLGSGRSISVGGALAGLGYCMGALLIARRLWLLYLAFSVAGLGSGVVYNAVLTNVNGRFADKRGTSSGVMLMGFGSSTLVIGSLAARLLLSPLGWRGTYILTGVTLALVSAVGGLLLYVETERGESAREWDEGMTSSQMLGEASFWLIFSAATINCFFGFGVLGHARYMALEAGVAEGASALVVGLISVMNGVGRLFFGMLHDKRGYRVSFPVSSCVFILAALLALLGIKTQTPILTVAGLMCGGFGNSAAPTVLTALAADFYGRRNYARNLSILNANMLPGSLGSTVAGTVQTASGSYAPAFLLFGALEIPALVFIKLLAKKQTAR